MRFLLTITSLTLVGMANAGEIDLFGGTMNGLTYDTSGTSTYPEFTASSFGIYARLAFITGDLPISPHIDAIAEMKFISDDTTGGKVLNLFLEGITPIVKARAGFNLDMSPGPSRFFDGQKAIMVGASTNFPVINASFDYIHLLPEENLHGGDILIIRSGLDLKVGLGNVVQLTGGLEGIYRKYMSDQYAYNLSVLPTLGLRFTSMAINLSIGFEDEYGFYGISVAGKESPATGVGIQLRLKYYF